MKKWMFFCAIALTSFAAQISAFQPCYQFNGLYFGGNIGVGNDHAHLKDVNSFLEDSNHWKNNNTNIVGGAQIGFDMQNGNAVFGIVGDWNSIDLGRKIHAKSNAEHTLTSDLNWFSTIRARAGMTFGSALFFLTGGAAVAEFKTEGKNADITFKNHKAHWGWTAGGGVEVYCCNNLTVGVDALYVQFPKKEHSIPATESTTFNFRRDDSTVLGRVFINYRLDDLYSAW